MLLFRLSLLLFKQRFFCVLHHYLVTFFKLNCKIRVYSLASLCYIAVGAQHCRVYCMGVEAVLDRSKQLCPDL